MRLQLVGLFQASLLDREFLSLWTFSLLLFHERPDHLSFLTVRRIAHERLRRERTFIKTTVDISLDSQNLHHHHRNRGWRDVYRWKLFFFLISRGSFLSFILCCIEERKRWHLSFWWSSSNWLGATEEGWKDTPNQWENHLKETSPDKPALFPFISCFLHPQTKRIRWRKKRRKRAA